MTCAKLTIIYEERELIAAEYHEGRKMAELRSVKSARPFRCAEKTFRNEADSFRHPFAC